MIFHVLELKLSQRYVGVDVWLWKVHPFQVNLQICWIKLKQKLSAKWHFELYLATPACLWSQNFQTWLGNIAHLLETWDKYLPVDSPTLFKRPIVYTTQYSSAGNNVYMLGILVDCPTQLICTWIFICCSMTKLKEHSREICYGNSFLHLPGTSKNKLFATNWQSEDIWCKKCCAWLIVFLKT